MSLKLRVAAALMLGSMSAQAADMPGQTVIEPRGCIAARRSPILDLPSPAEMRQQVEQRMVTAIEVATAERTITNTSPRFVWASETKAYCGMAVGYFAGGEVNDETITKCDCFYQRMQRFSQAAR